MHAEPQPRACRLLICSGCLRPPNSFFDLSAAAPGFLFERNPPRSFFERFEMRRVLLVVFLVIRFGRIKFHRRQNFGDDRSVEFARARELLFCCLSIFFLVVATVENRGAITWAD